MKRIALILVQVAALELNGRQDKAPRIPPKLTARLLAAIVLSGALGILASASSVAQTPNAAVPITAEPDHKIRFDNGDVRMYEVVLPKGKATLLHEHRSDSFNVFFQTAEITNEPQGGKPATLKIPAGAVRFASTAKGPYSHRIIVTGESTFHVIAMELMSPAPTEPASVDQRTILPFKVVLENPRGRVYRVTLAPGESTQMFTRPTKSALFAISAGRISENSDGKAPRMWDFEPGHFRWLWESENLSLKNESHTPIELVEIEVF